MPENPSCSKSLFSILEEAGCSTSATPITPGLFMLGIHDCTEPDMIPYVYITDSSLQILDFELICADPTTKIWKP